MSQILYADESYQIMGACFEVYNDKGHGYVEPVYQECLEIEMTSREIPFVAQKAFQLTYKGHVLRQTFVPDFVCFDKMVLEIKSVKGLLDEHRAQVINYLKVTGMKLGLLVNFGAYPKVQYERLVL